MKSAPFVSYAQNGEDVVLFRALRKIDNGRYVDVGANDPVDFSITYAFYQRGWSGITIDPVHAYAEKLRAVRPRDVVVEVAISDDPSGSVTLHQIADTGLSTLMEDVGAGHRDAGWEVEDVTVPARGLDAVLTDAGWQGLDIHFMVVDTEGAERTVLQTIDLRRWRPWVLVVEATKPLTSEATYHSWESILTTADYRFCLFDGLSRFYVAAEKWDDLHAPLSVPANILDDYSSYLTIRREKEVARLTKAATDLTADRDRIADDRDRIRAEHDRAAEEARRRDEQNAAAILHWRTAALRTWRVPPPPVTIGPTRKSRRTKPGPTSRSRCTSTMSSKWTTRSIGSGLSSRRSSRPLSWRITTPLRRVRGATKRPTKRHGP